VRVDAPVSVFLVLAAVVLFSIKVEHWVPRARVFGSVLLSIFFAGVLANIGILPGQSSAYSMLGGLGVSLGIALVLLGVNLDSIRRAGPRMAAAFGLGAVGTGLGATLAAPLLYGALGPETWKLAGQYAGTYIGGGVNMVAVGRTVGTSPEVFTAAVAADNVTTAAWLMVCLSVPVVLRRWWPVHEGTDRQTDADVAAEGAAEVARFTRTRGPLTLEHTATLVVLAVGAVWAASALARAVPRVPEVLWLTTIVLLVAQVPSVRRLTGGLLLGNYVLHLFLASLGAQSIVMEIVRVGPAVFYFTVVVVVVHGLLLFGAGRLLGFDLPTLAVASQANVGGPPSAMALATARGYTDQLLPGVAVGLVGYAIGNYAGVGVAHLVRLWLGS
jgi:uncharacterized membrane protein